MITEIEISILLYLQEHWRGAFDGFWQSITVLADLGWFWIALGVGLLFFKQTRMIGITMLISMLINICITNLTLKEMIARVRPYNLCKELIPITHLPSDYSFPSGHTSISFAGALVLYRMMPKYVGIPAIILASLIGFSRMYIGVHYPTDVLGGVIVGIISSYFAWKIMEFFQKKTGGQQWRKRKNKN